jgi:type 1 glutamine amidotransferase
LVKATGTSATDEIYVSEIADDLHVILDTEYDGDCPGFEIESVPGRTRHPILYTRPQGAGEVTYFTLGHCRGRFDISDMGVDDIGVIDRVAWDSSEFLEIMRRSVAWAVHGSDWSECSVSQEGAAA